MRMIGKAGDVVARVVAAELVEHQEGVETGSCRCADDARELDAGAVAGRHPLGQLDDLPGSRRRVQIGGRDGFRSGHVHAPWPTGLKMGMGGVGRKRCGAGPSHPCPVCRGRASQVRRGRARPGASPSLYIFRQPASDSRARTPSSRYVFSQVR